jgi:lysophospholipase L1-like esterase
VWFRASLGLVSVCLGVLAVWLGTHVSSRPTVFGRYSPSYFGLLTAASVLVLASLALQSARVRRRLSGVGRGVLLGAVSLGVSLIAVEAAIRWLDPLGLSHLAEASRYHLDKIADPVLVYAHAPNQQRTYQGVVVSTNALGLREREESLKAPGELRVLCLGDSVTFGWGVQVEQAFPRLLESALADQLKRAVRTINAGVGSYNTVQQHAFLSKHFDVLAPGVVLLLYVVNDVEVIDLPFDPWSQRSLSGKSPPEVLRLLLGRSWLFRLAGFASGTLYRRDEARRFDENSRGVRESMAALAGMADLCRRRNVKFVTFFYRPKQPDPESERLLSLAVSVGRREQFPVVDIASWWRDVDMRAVTNSVVDTHPNAAGHEILARGMSQYITGLLDPARASR